MVKTCCIDGCSEINPAAELRYFKFPKNRANKQRWLRAIQTSAKINCNSLVCSSHFLESDYELVHGRRTLRSSVVPTLSLGRDSSLKRPETPTKRSSPRKKPSNTDDKDKIEAKDTPEPTATDTVVNKDGGDVPDTNLVEELKCSADSNGIAKNDEENMRVDENKIADVSSPKDTTLSQTITDQTNTNGLAQTGNGPDRSPQTRPEIATVPTDILTKIPSTDNQSLLDNLNPDYEELIKETHVRTADLKVVCEGDEAGVQVIDKFHDKMQEPVFISIPVSVPGSGQSPQRSPDCMMVMESLQVELDPACVYHHFDDEGPGDVGDAGDVGGVGGAGDDDDDVELIEKPNDPVSLLTSSDDDDVIIEEPKIDTVDVSDETDEDDLPLTRYLKTKKGLAEFEKNLKDLFWGTAKEYYCYSCSFTSKSKADLTRHMESHAKTSQIYVCPVCSFQSASKGQFARHKRKHKEEKRYKCHICDYRARHKMSLVYHVKMHTNKDKNVYHKCKMCDYKTDDRLKMHKHLKSKHQVKIYVCTMCNYSTKRQHDLKKHTRVRHSERTGSDEEYTPGNGD